MEWLANLIVRWPNALASQVLLLKAAHPQTQ